MKPAQSTEARLFAVEAQVYETENERVAEFHYMKDIMKKLVFAIEQQLSKTIETSMSNV